MNSEHVAELKKGVEHWNEWYRSRYEEIPFFYADLSEISLRNEDECGPHLRDEAAYGADLTGVWLLQADLRRANLPLANFNRAMLYEAKFDGARLTGASFIDADLGQARLNNCVLFAANLTGAKLSGADFTGAMLRGASGIQFDSNRIRDVQLDWNCGWTWPWSRKIRSTWWPTEYAWIVLQRAYSGSALIFNTLLTTLFLAPYAVRAALWHSANRAQEAAGQLGRRIEENLPAQDVPPEVYTAIESLKQMEPGGADPGTTYYLWQVLLGVDRGWWPPILAVAVLLYNGVRWHLTSRVSWMRDEQERTGTTPAKDDYWRLFLVHRWSLILIALVVVSFTVNAVSWLGEEVWIPDWG